MARVLPTSLSPHICVLQSEDLEHLLLDASLPSLPHIFQSVSPLNQITTRTTSLTSVQHPSFHLRFSSLPNVEAACKEDEESRALRTIDWIGGRISRRCEDWVDNIEREREMAEVLKSPLVGSFKGKAQSADVGARTPWWDELRRCAEGEATPNRFEGWNHPSAVIIAVSTAIPNPLQAITALHSRPLEFPSWVDPTHLTYTLIVHPQGSQLSDQEAIALVNAVKRQYGLHTYLLPLALPSPPPAPMPAPALLPQLPLSKGDTEFNTPDLSQDVPPTPISAVTHEALNALRMCEPDIQATSKFVREFVTQSLVPWMERSVLEWNENYTSTRRLPSRLFSSTRRLFGSGYGSSPSPAPTHARSNTLNNTPQPPPSQTNVPGAGGIIGQQRRLAEFATILGDYKLATGVWEALRKDGRGGAEVLPLLLAPGPSVAALAQVALAGMTGAGEVAAQLQMQALRVAVRWETGIAPADFASDVLQGERWLMWASGNAEEAPSALLLAHAAHVSARKRLKRHAALWYLIAANRLEKCGIKPLTMFFLRQAHQLYATRPEKALSPSFWDSEGCTEDDWRGFEDVVPGIQGALGKLMYTFGDAEGAVRIFLRLLKPTTPLGPPVGWTADIAQTDRVVLEDFKVAFEHFLATSQNRRLLADLQLPVTFCVPRETKVRLPREGLDNEKSVWASREESWRQFWKPHGNERLINSGKAAINETFWLDVVLRNPLNVEAELANITFRVSHADGGDDVGPADNFVDIEILDRIKLDPAETRTVPLAITCRQPASLVFTELSYAFLGLLPNVESLRIRGRRLHDTPQQRTSKVYAPESSIKIDVEDTGHRLAVDFSEDGELVLAQGECRQLGLWLSNEGTTAIGEIWVLPGADDHIWIDEDQAGESADPELNQVIRSANSLAPRRPYRIPLSKLHSGSALLPGQNLTLPIAFHTDQTTESSILSLLFVYREADGSDFYSLQLRQHYEALPLLEISAAARPSRSLDHMFKMTVEVNQLLSVGDVHITQMTTVSPSWTSELIGEPLSGVVSPQQTARTSFALNPWEGAADALASERFAMDQLGLIIEGRRIPPVDPPPIDLLCSSLLKGDRLLLDSSTQHFLNNARRSLVAKSTASAHPLIPVSQHSSVFPLYHPGSVDVLIHWSLPSQGRQGFALAHGVTLGAAHAPLYGALAQAEGARAARNIYAETARERLDMLAGVRASVWNREMDPIVVTVSDEQVEHNFEVQGPCHIPVTFALRNFSLTHPCRYHLKLVTPSTYPPISDLLPPQYSGRQTFRGELPPASSATVKAKLWVSRPGAYALTGWTVETEIGEPGEGEWRTRHRYLQNPSSGHRACVLVSDRRT